MKKKALIYTFVSSLILFTSYAGFEALAVPPDKNWGVTGYCYYTTSGNVEYMTCCWEEPDILNPGETITWCQSCVNDSQPPTTCSEIFIDKPSATGPFVPSDDGVLEQPEESSPNDNNDIPKDGVLEQPEESSPNDNNDIPKDGTAEEPTSPFQGSSPNTPFNRGGVLEQ